MQEVLTTNDSRPFMSSFMEHLIRQQIITKELAMDAIKGKDGRNGRSKKSLVELLVDEYAVPRDVLYREVAQFYSFRIIDVADHSPRRFAPATVNRLLAGLPASMHQLAMKHKVLPYEIPENQPDKLIVVTPHPSNREVNEVARCFPYKKFEICYMPEKDWAEFWRQVTIDKQHVGGGLSFGEVFDEEETELDNVLDQEINRSQLISLIENIFVDAVRVGASDIHVIPRGARKTVISFRIDGQLSEWYTVEDARAEAVTAVVKGHGINLDRFERMAAQDGAAQKIVDNQTIRYRISILPIISKELGGKLESVVIRILRDADASVTLENIGFDPYSLRMFREAISKPHGIVILTGPTGSGKSTTLVAALRSVMDPTLNTITVEDPVEYLLEGARQIKLNHKLSFDDAIRAILRHDPDIVMVGEIRDRITADIAIKLANTGHLTFSTLHTNDAPSAITRLFKIGVEPFLIAQALNIVVAQRLVRKLCDRCKGPAENLSHSFLIKVGFKEDELKTLLPFRAVGCIHCVHGFKGRTAIHESLFFTPEIRDIVLESGERIDIDAVRKSALRSGMQTLRRSGLELAKKGITTIDEVVSSTTHE
jgi:type IV pilus assembly protein PilB